MLAAILSLTLAQVSFVPGDGGAIDFLPQRLTPLSVEGAVAVQPDRRGYRIIWSDRRRATAGGADVDDLFTNLWLPAIGALESPTGSPLLLNPDQQHARNPVLAADSNGGLLLVFDESSGTNVSLRARSLTPQPNSDGGATNLVIARGALAPQGRTANLVHDGTSFVAGWRMATLGALAFQRLDHSGLIGDAGLERWLPADPTGGPFLAGERTPVTIASNWTLAPTAHTSELVAGQSIPGALAQSAGRVAGIIANGSADPTVLVESDAGALVDFGQPTLQYVSSISPGQRIPTQRAGPRVLALVHRAAGWTLGVLNPGLSGVAVTPWPTLADGGSLTPVALGGDGGLSTLALELQQNVLFLRPIIADGGLGYSPAPTASVVSQALALQRDPSLVWSEADEAFLVAFNQYTVDQRWETVLATVALDGTTSTPQPVRNLMPSSIPTRPRVLRRPTGPGLALLVDQTASASTLFELVPVGGGVFGVGTQLGLTQPNNAGGALGNTNSVLWDQSSTVAVSGASTPTMWVGPSCAAFTSGFHWLFGFARTDAGTLTQLRVSDSPGGAFLSRPVEDLLGSTPICAATGADGRTLAGAYEQGGAVVLFGVDSTATGNLLALTGYAEVDAGQGATKPKLVAFGAGQFLVAWETRPEGVNAALVSDAGVIPISLDTQRSLDAKNVALATSPSGVAALAWQEFDRTLGSTQIRVRLVVPSPSDGGVDGGPGSDAGADAGQADGGGAADGGLDGGPGPDGDAGSLADGGAADAGPGADGGAQTDGGGQSTTLLVPASCGCSSGPGAGAVLVAWLLWRWRRRIRLSAGPS